jgi:hypothetical protein
MQLIIEYKCALVLYNIFARIYSVLLSLFLLFSILFYSIICYYDLFYYALLYYSARLYVFIPYYPIIISFVLFLHVSHILILLSTSHDCS